MQEEKVIDNGYILKAGAIVVKKDKYNKIYCLLTYRKMQDDYSFPKGHMEKGETPQDTAIREVLEETGCEIEILGEIVPTFYNYPDSGKCKVFMFIGKAISEGDGIEDNETSVWIPFEKVVETLTYQNLKDLFLQNKDEIWLKLQ